VINSLRLLALCSAVGAQVLVGGVAWADDAWVIGYTDLGAYALCDFDDGTRVLCPDQEHPYVECFLPDGRTVLCPDRDVHR
jgi:hypothetical protein